VSGGACRVFQPSGTPIVSASRAANRCPLAIALFWVAPDPSNVFTNSLVSRRTNQIFESHLTGPTRSAGRGVTDQYWLTLVVMLAV